MAEKNLKVKKASDSAKATSEKKVEKKPAKTSTSKNTEAKSTTKAPAKVVKAEKLVAEKIIQFAVGRRKRSVARVRMYSGNGEIVINGKSVEEYAPSKAKLSEFLKPLEVSGVREGHKFTAKVIGGGISGQLDATKHGIARVIAKINEDLKKTMKQGGFLTRDPREKERKKVYHVRARKSPQFSKR
jgi:small subunit ribosomal protein S9